MRTRVRKGRTILSREQERAQVESILDGFNRRHPVGSRVWYWVSLPFGPVKETTVREAAWRVRDGDSNAGMPVVLLTGVRGYVSVFHVQPVDEPRRLQINPEVLA